jgi:CheY-like chemotaxis protein/HPt (histidine-containing phosphotransfer) domain-containing protein
VGNAIKFTEQGQVTVACHFKSSSSKSLLFIDITDSGIGIAADKIETIFDPFTQADSAITRRFGGTGLGLSISRKFARALGGDITVKSEAGKGSTFTVAVATGDVQAVPLLQPDEVEKAAQVQVATEQAVWQFPDARVLIVDDGAENRELLKLLLQDAGLMVDEAENGQVGVEKATAHRYDVILMDVNMPVMDGFTATQNLRQQGVETPIIALTANAMAGFEQECLDVGYTGYLSKPVDLDRFMALMAELLGGRQVSSKTAADAVPAAASAPDSRVNRSPSVESAPIRSTLPEGNEKFRKLIAQFALRLDERLKIVARSHAQGNRQEIADFAHWLKGAGGTIGFNEFTVPAGNLEKLAKNGSSDADIEQSIECLKGLAARLVVPGAGPKDAATPSGTTQPDPSTVTVLLTSIQEPATRQPVTSRLASMPQFQNVIAKFAEKLNAELVKAKSDLDAGNLEALALFAHWLKGSGGTVGFDEFTTPANRLETFSKTAQPEQAGQVLEQVKQLSDAIVLPGVAAGQATGTESAAAQPAVQ